MTSAEQKVIAFPHGLSTPEQRVQWIKDTFGKKPPQVEIRTMRDALKWGGEWEAYARRLEAQVARLEMLAQVAQIHEKTSDTLREYAEAELMRIRGESGGNAGG